MNLLKTGTLTWQQMGLLKLCLLAIGIAIGANWPEVFAPYTLWLVILGVALGLYVGTAWFKK